MDICVSADHKNAIWKLFKTFPSWNCLERLQTTLPYGLVACGLMHANTAVPASPPSPSMMGPAILQGCIRFRMLLNIFLHFLQLNTAAFSSHSHHLCSQPARYRQLSTHRNKWPLHHPMHVCFSFLIQKLPLEAFRSKQNAYSASSGKFCFISLLKRLFVYLTSFSPSFSLSTPCGVLVWQTFMMLLLLPSPFPHLVHPLAEP